MAAGRPSRNPSSSVCAGWHPRSSTAAGSEGRTQADDFPQRCLPPLKPAEAPPAEVTLHSPHPFLCLFLPPPPPSSHSLLLCFPIKPFLVSPWRWCQSQRWGWRGSQHSAATAEPQPGAVPEPEPGWQSRARGTSSPPRAEQGLKEACPASGRGGSHPHPTPHKDGLTDSEVYRHSPAGTCF